MNALVQWFAPDVLRTLGLALAHFLWQGAALGALAAAAIAASRSASTRYRLGVAALALMLAAPVATFLSLRESVSAPDPGLASPPPSLVLADHGAMHLSYHPAAAPRADVLNWVVALWFAGVVLFSLRTAGGFLLLARLRRRDAKPVEARLLALGRELEG